MKPKLNITLLFVGGLLACSASEVAPGNAPSPGALLAAIARVESGNDPAAVGDGGRATGAWQMHAGARADARAMLRVPATATVTDRDLARAYLAHLNARLATALKRQPSAAESYAAWNLGYTGFKRRGFQVERCPAVTRKAAAKLLLILKTPPAPNNFPASHVWNVPCEQRGHGKGVIRARAMPGISESQTVEKQNTTKGRI